MRIAGVQVHALDLEGAARAIVAAAVERRFLSVHLCNAYVLALASRDPAYSALLSRGDLNLADGAPVAWFASRAGLEAQRRPSGTELVQDVVRLGSPKRIRHYFYGSTPEVVEALATSLRASYPGVELVGVHAPPYGQVTEEQAQQLARAAAVADAQVIWIGLGTPKQDELVERMRGQFAGACVPVGAAFDFLAGSTPRAPRWLRRLGLEWLHRLLVEPRRLWRRYLWGNLRFLWALISSGRVLRRDHEDTA